MEAFVRYDPSADDPSHLFCPPRPEASEERAALKGGELVGQ